MTGSPAMTGQAVSVTPGGPVYVYFFLVITFSGANPTTQFGAPVGAVQMPFAAPFAGTNLAAPSPFGTVNPFMTGVPVAGQTVTFTQQVTTGPTANPFATNTPNPFATNPFATGAPAAAPFATQPAAPFATQTANPFASMCHTFVLAYITANTANPFMTYQ